MLNRIVGFHYHPDVQHRLGANTQYAVKQCAVRRQSMPGMSGHDMSTMQMKDMPTGGDTIPVLHREHVQVFDTRSSFLQKKTELIDISRWTAL